jgi:hypothetical protein
MRRTVLALLTGALLFAFAAPAWAHEEINPATVTVGKPTYLTFSAANEEKVDLVGVTLKAPAGLNFGGTTRSPAGWTVDRTDTQISWSGGTVKPDNFEQWGFEVEGAGQPGSYTYTAQLKWSDGKTDSVTVPITAKAAGSGTTTTKKAAAPKTSNRRATVALLLGFIALIIAIVALVMGRRSGGPAGSGGSASSTGSGAGKW